MAEDDRARLLGRSLKALQRNLQRSAPAVTASYALIGSIGLFGVIGYAIDARFGTGPAFLVGGLMLGIAAGLYQLARTIWRR